MVVVGELAMQFLQWRHSRKQQEGWGNSHASRCRCPDPRLCGMIVLGIKPQGPTCASMIFCLESTAACISAWSFFSSSSTDISLLPGTKIKVRALLLQIAFSGACFLATWLGKDMS